MTIGEESPFRRTLSSNQSEPPIFRFRLAGGASHQQIHFCGTVSQELNP